MIGGIFQVRLAARYAPVASKTSVCGARSTVAKPLLIGSTRLPSGSVMPSKIWIRYGVLSVNGTVGVIVASRFAAS